MLLNLESYIQSNHGIRHECGLRNGRIGILVGEGGIAVLIVVSRIYIVVVRTVGGVVPMQGAGKIVIQSAHHHQGKLPGHGNMVFQATAQPPLVGNYIKFLVPSDIFEGPFERGSPRTQNDV
jgi:hypothetical protein